MKKATIAALVLAASSLCAVSVAVASNDPAASGKLFLVDGTVLIQRSVQAETAAIDSIIGVGDSILTADTGTAQWQMSDTSIFALAPESGFKINKYALPHSKNAEGLASYTLLHGAVHTVTGTIGKAAAANASMGRFSPARLVKVAAAPAGPYTLKTTLAVITSKGADFVAVQTDKILKVLVNVGSATVCTVAGCASPVAGEGVVVNCDGCKPTVAAAATLGLDSLVASLEFNLQLMAPLAHGDQITDPRKQPLSAVLACRTVLAHLEGAARCGRLEGTMVESPVSPN